MGILRIYMDAILFALGLAYLGSIAEMTGILREKAATRATPKSFISYSKWNGQLWQNK